ncbi:histidine kinase [Aliifodinibius sp. S!AR15-10]|uniref:sensor histidine kinase n=1 Tax=Aliifodinibius sp. S!AR15-10 TaxID=2950437 RepID=UPI002858054E|nr:two-component regulator propeller domain-containing protein [Aliifodinibius sp. S!AR15-10]MDR8390543.1 histidine kinase [Aliifodinibius sp. S!AR15-10]
MRKRIVIFLLCLICSASVQSQVLPFRTYSIENGLSEAVVNDMIQDSDGYIWIATGYGLNRFDGINFRNYYQEDGLADNKIQSLYQDNEGRIWVGTESGVNVIEDDSIKTIPSLEPLTSSTILEVFEDENGDFWFATDGDGIWHEDDSGDLIQYTTVHGLAGDRVRDIIEDEDGTLWFGTREGLTSLSGGNFRSYTPRHGLADEKIRDLELDPSGGFWIATRGGLSHFEDGQFRNLTEADDLVNNRIRSISQDGAGGVWLGTEEGTSHYSNGVFKNYTTSQGLSNNIIYSTLFDREHNIWFGTFGGGINLFLGENFKNFTIEEGLPNNVITSINQDMQGNYWITTYGGGIVRYNEEGFEILNERDGLVDNKVYTSMVDSQGRLFIGTRWGLSIYDGNTFFNFDETELPYRKIRSIVERSTRDEYWMATYGEGVLRYRDQEFRLFSEDDGLANNTVLSVEEDDQGNLWFATYGGVSRFSDGEFTNFSIRDGLPNNGVLDILEDRRGRLWFSTFGGIALYEDGTFESITTQDGLPDQVCYFIIEDQDGIKWIGTNKGVVRFDYEMYRDATEEKASAFKLITHAQGLVANEMNVGAGFTDDNGELWFGSVGGVTRYTKEAAPSKNVPPKIHIENIRVSGEPAKTMRNLQIESDNHNIVINFIGISFTGPEQVVYEYRLKGSAEGWQRTNQRFARYSALLPGEYTFEVRAQSNGLWSQEKATVSFTVLAPFWMRWWFIVLLILAVAGIIYFIYHYYRVRKMVEIERMRVRIASDLHDDVGSSLTEIALQTDFLQTTKLRDDVKKSLSQIGDQSRKIVSSLDDIVWSIDARNDTLGDLTDRMQDYVNNVLPGKEISYQFNRLDMDEKLTVPMKENIYLIFKEAINNIAKHADATKVEVELKNDNGSFDMYIRDNGSGIGEQARKSGHGLRNMQMRARRIDADIDFENGTGFTIHLHGDKI